MNSFIHEHFLLETKTAQQLYHDVAASLPIIDYHNHLPVQEIAENKKFSSLTEIWLKGDHYKWRAMRTRGVAEQYITGQSSDEEKFMHWAQTVPETWRNPLFHWTHLELKRYFDIDNLLNSKTAESIYSDVNDLLKQDDFRVLGLLKKQKVEIVCTTDDPIDSLEYHQQIKHSSIDLKVFPTFRPDKAVFFENADYLYYLNKLGNSANHSISSLSDLIEVLDKRHLYFHQNGCRVSDMGLTHISTFSASIKQLESWFLTILSGGKLQKSEFEELRGYVIHELALMNHSRGWVQQLHLGALRNNSSRMKSILGLDAGFDSIGDFPQAESLSYFLNSLDRTNQLSKTILYNLNPADNEVFATMCGNFNDGSERGKIQWGSAWWFLDQLDGMTKQINTLSNMGLLSTFVGMLTDSRSFLSFPRHEYFRRLLCNVIGTDMEKGLLPNDMDQASEIIRNVCYANAKNYFRFHDIP